MTGFLGYLAGFLTNAAIYAMFALGLNIQFGTTGLINFGHVAFLAIGAYTTALLTVAGVAFGWALLAGTVASLLVSFLLAYPVVRLRDDYLAILTIGFAEIVRILANNLRFTGGPQGVWGIKPPMLTWGLSYDLWRWMFLGLCVLLLALVMILVQYITRSPYGRVLMAIREDQDAAVSLGKNITTYKLVSFGLGAAVAGLAGGLLAAFLQTITPNNFVALVTFEAWIIMVLGGAGRNWGIILGALIYYGLFTASSRLVVMGIGGLQPAALGALRLALIGALLIALMIYRPQGILGRKEDLTVGR